MKNNFHPSSLCKLSKPKIYRKGDGVSFESLHLLGKMDFLNSWLQGIIVAVIIATIIEMILPNGNSKKYIKVVLGIYVVFNIITPVANKITNNNFQISSVFNIEDYEKKMKKYEVSTNNANEKIGNESDIKKVYISKLKKDIKSKLEEKGYRIKKIEVEAEDDYSIKTIVACLEEKQTENDNASSIQIKEIETVNIQINKNENLIIEEESAISKKEQEEIKKYLATIYEIKEEQITIY